MEAADTLHSLAWSERVFRSTGLSQSLQRTTPRSDLSGSMPKIFISRAESHDVGGEGSSDSCVSFGGVFKRGVFNESQEKGDGE